MAFGTFFRSTLLGDGDALIYGTLKQPKISQGMEFYNDAAQFPNIKVVSGGLETIHKSLKERTSRPGTLALRDYFPLWKQEGMGRDAQKLTGGKLLVLGSCRASSDHHMFFDD